MLRAEIGCRIEGPGVEYIVDSEGIRKASRNTAGAEYICDQKFSRVVSSEGVCVRAIAGIEQRKSKIMELVVVVIQIEAAVP